MSHKEGSTTTEGSGTRGLPPPTGGWWCASRPGKTHCAAADAGPHSTSTGALLRTPPCNDEDDNVQHGEGCTTYEHMNMFKTRRHQTQANRCSITLHSPQAPAYSLKDQNNEDCDADAHHSHVIIFVPRLRHML